MALPVDGRLEELGLFGGRPEFASPLHVGQPNLPDRGRFMARVESMLDRRWFTNRGPYVQELEARICELLGVRECIAVCNATVALEIAARALRLKGEVIVPSFTFVATAHCLQWQEITPVFCDIDPETHNLDPSAVLECITRRTTGIIGVHVWGRACDTAALTAIASEHGLRLMFDAAHAFGCSTEGTMVGNFGELEVFSFHSTKAFSTFEGGAIVTNNTELAARIRLMQNFGFSGYDNVVCLGTNGKMSEVCAAMGLALFDSYPSIVAHNRSIYDIYREVLSGRHGIRFARYNEVDRNNYHYVAVEIDEQASGLARDTLLALLRAENVLARRYFFPGCHRMEPYRTLFPEVHRRLPHTERLARRILCLPNGTAVSGADSRRIASLIAFALDHADELAARRRADPGGVHLAGCDEPR